MALACGGVLIAWSLIAGRDDLWSIGLPLAVVGQGGLVIGLLLQLDGLWQSSKKTEETLTQLDCKLHDLAHTTTMLGTTRSTPAQSFYVHMAEGASPHLLLADLKGQLDARLVSLRPPNVQERPPIPATRVRHPLDRTGAGSAG